MKPKPKEFSLNLENILEKMSSEYDYDDLFEYYTYDEIIEMLKNGKARFAIRSTSIGDYLVLVIE